MSSPLLVLSLYDKAYKISNPQKCQVLLQYSFSLLMSIAILTTSAYYLSHIEVSAQCVTNDGVNVAAQFNTALILVLIYHSIDTFRCLSVLAFLLCYSNPKRDSFLERSYGLTGLNGCLGFVVLAYLHRRLTSDGELCTQTFLP